MSRISAPRVWPSTLAMSLAESFDWWSRSEAAAIPPATRTLSGWLGSHSISPLQSSG